MLRKSPTESDAPPCIVDFNERNVFRIFINRNDEIMVEDEISKAYYDLRSNYAKKVLNKSSEELTKKEFENV